MICSGLSILLLLSSSPLLESEDFLDRGTTAIYTISLVEGVDYWVLLNTDNPDADFDIVVASKEMDFDQFMMMPYYEDYIYAREFILAEGVNIGNESFTLSSTYTGPAYIVVHDIGETGGSYTLTVY